MRDLDMERHLMWMNYCTWAKILASGIAVFMFLMFAALGLSAWVWWAAWPVMGLALVARAVGEHHHREFQELLRRSYQEPWWLSGEAGHMDTWRRNR